MLGSDQRWDRDEDLDQNQLLVEHVDEGYYEGIGSAGLALPVLRLTAWPLLDLPTLSLPKPSQIAQSKLTSSLYHVNALLQADVLASPGQGGWPICWSPMFRSSLLLSFAVFGRVYSSAGPPGLVVHSIHSLCLPYLLPLQSPPGALPDPCASKRIVLFSLLLLSFLKKLELRVHVHKAALFRTDSAARIQERGIAFISRERPQDSNYHFENKNVFVIFYQIMCLGV